MPRHKRPLPRKSNNITGPDVDSQAQALADLALAIVEHEDDDLQQQAGSEAELATEVRRALRRRHDEVLYGAVELARYSDPEACRLLRGRIEEEAATLRIRREDAPELEIDAFLVPIFVQSAGGLNAAEAFQDDAAYEALTASFKQAGLDSLDAKVALIRYAYDLDEIDGINYSTLHEMLREAAASLLDKKLAPAPLIEASMRGWTGEGFAPDEMAMQLRFLLGFSLKRADDPFYRVPDDEAGADAYFERRMERYQRWTADVEPLVARCLAFDPGRLTLNFLYQDLFYGAKEQGLSELAMLGTLSEVSRVLAEKQLEAQQVHAVVAPLEGVGQIVLRINLYAVDGGPPWATLEKPVDLSADLGSELDDLCEALVALGLEGVSVAEGFDADGHPQGAEPYAPDADEQ
ncbi:hypothetical protein [Massilia horti]|uniref:DUF2863 family protein n=1 Tax=Massilia horti TaxID=2562153 RepID=A0A4Y9T5E9_9BURK|nr:hypothetical protein [Massilia horti]TFW35353.1 hypothetical protein E4O92_02070 [Massilia horti]